MINAKYQNLSKLSQEVQNLPVHCLKTKFSNKLKDYNRKKKQRELSRFSGDTLEIKRLDQGTSKSVETLIDKDIQLS